MLNMRHALLPYVGWFGVVQSLAPPSSSVDTTARLVGLATLLGSLTVLVYRLGVWRQELENTKDNVAAEVKAHRDESAVNFNRIERRLDAIDHLVSDEADFRRRIERGHARVERRLERVEAALALNGTGGE